jgi:uncharacterized membrane protein YkoI
MLKIVAFLVMVLVAGSLWAPAAHAALADGACTENWSDMAAAVKANGLTPAKNLQQLAHGKVDGKLVKVGLCLSGGAYRYELVFLQEGGQLVTTTVDAKTPFPQ